MYFYEHVLLVIWSPKYLNGNMKLYFYDVISMCLMENEFKRKCFLKEIRFERKIRFFFRKKW
jgi:hypothetical protein